MQAGESRMVTSYNPADALPCQNSISAVAAGNPQAKFRDCVKWKNANAAVANQALQRSWMIVATRQPAATKSSWSLLYAQQKELVRSWNHVVRGVACEYYYHSKNQPLSKSTQLIKEAVHLE